jgi:POT family proton-dependent oligopeptide transporter
MGWGMIVLGAGFVVMWGAQNVVDGGARAAIWWLMLVYLLHTTGELFLSPIGLSLVTKLSPVRVVSTMMGLWFASAALADYMAQRMEEIVHHFDLPLWQTLIGTSLGGGIVLLALTPLLKKWMHGRG